MIKNSVTFFANDGTLDSDQNEKPTITHEVQNIYSML